MKRRIDNVEGRAGLAEIMGFTRLLLMGVKGVPDWATPQLTV
jgi:hypothetical protein